jgi:hypothetical protein
MAMRPGVHLLLTPLIEVGGTAPVQAVPAPWHQYIYQYRPRKLSAILSAEFLLR